mmetsp:Transcript_5733/g.17075  ORF Transcript_5733/g.17075 Transcript_5733/m.17075 type:complete len:206 (+) Transcript_5733:1914-2531(+)
MRKNSFSRTSLRPIIPPALFSLSKTTVQLQIFLHRRKAAAKSSLLVSSNRDLPALETGSEPSFSPRTNCLGSWYGRLADRFGPPAGFAALLLLLDGFVSLTTASYSLASFADHDRVLALFNAFRAFFALLPLLSEEFSRLALMALLGSVTREFPCGSGRELQSLVHTSPVLKAEEICASSSMSMALLFTASCCRDLIIHCFREEG